MMESGLSSLESCLILRCSLFLRGCTSIERPVAQASTCTAFGFADAQVDLALAEIEKGFSLAQQREAAYSKCRVGPHLH